MKLTKDTADILRTVFGSVDGDVTCHPHTYIFNVRAKRQSDAAYELARHGIVVVRPVGPGCTNLMEVVPAFENRPAPANASRKPACCGSCGRLIDEGRCLSCEADAREARRLQEDGNIC